MTDIDLTCLLPFCSKVESPLNGLYLPPATGVTIKPKGIFLTNLDPIDEKPLSENPTKLKSFKDAVNSEVSKM